MVGQEFERNVLAQVPSQLAELLALVPLQVLGLRASFLEQFRGQSRLLGRAEDRGTHAFGDRDDVRAGLAVDRDLDGLDAVDARDDFALGERARDDSDVLDANRRLAAFLEREVLDLVHVLELVHRPHEVLGRALTDLAGRRVQVLLREPRADRAGVDALGGEGRGVDADQDLLDQPAAHLHGGHAVDAFERALDALLGDPAQADEVLVALRGAERRPYPDAQDRVQVRVVAQDQRALSELRQLHVVQAIAHLLDRERHARAPVELEHHVAESGAADGGTAHQVRQRRQRFLHADRHAVLDVLGRGAWVGGAHRQRRVADLGQEVDGQLRERHDTEHRERDEQHRDRDGTRRDEGERLARRLRGGRRTPGGGGVLVQRINLPLGRPRRSCGSSAPTLRAGVLHGRWTCGRSP